MAGYEKIIFDELHLHHIRLPNRLTAPCQVQIRKDNQIFGRFTLDQVFDGDFSSVVVGSPTDIASIEHTLSDAYGVTATMGMSGVLGLLRKFHVRFEGIGAKKIRITSLGGTLQEADQGELLIALNGASARQDGPLQRGSIALVIVAVASVKDFAIDLETELGAQVITDTELAEALEADAALSATVVRNGGLAISCVEPMPFAVWLWTVKLPLIGTKLKIASSRRALDVLGDGWNSSEFKDDAGIFDHVVDLTSDD